MTPETTLRKQAKLYRKQATELEAMPAVDKLEHDDQRRRADMLRLHAELHDVEVDRIVLGQQTKGQQ